MANDIYIAVGDTMVSLRDRHAIARGGGIITPTGTLFGMNVGDGNPRADQATRLADFGRIPAARGPYYSGLPVAFDLSLSTTRSPEKRGFISFDVSPSTILSGGYDASITSWAQSVPADWQVWLTWKSEPNNHITTGEYTAQQYHDGQVHISQLLASLTSADRVFPNLIISAPENYPSGVQFDINCLPTFTEMGNANATMSWDNYGNPGGGAALYGLTGTYPPIDKVQDLAYGHLGDKGWLDGPGRYGITECNAPARSFDTDNSVRAQWITDYVNGWLNRAVKPHHILLWEGNGTNQNQNFTTTNCRDAFKAFVANSI